MAKRFNHFNRREKATVLAALRYWQYTTNGTRSRVLPSAPSADDSTQGAAIVDISTDGGAVRPLDAAEIDVLCERVNCDG